MSKQPLIDQLNDAVQQFLGAAGSAPPSADPAIAELIALAGELRDLPDPNFRTRLRESLERSASMTTKTVVFRPGFKTVTPYLLPPNTDLLDFVKTAFGAEETVRHSSGPGRFHAEVRIGNSMVMIGGGSGRSMPAAMQLNVPNADEVYRRALDAGAVSLNPVVEEHGMRFGCVQDPAQNHWYITTHLVKQPTGTVSTYFHPNGAARFIEFLQRGLGGVELERYDFPEGKVLHATIQIGDSVVQVGEPDSWWQPMPTMLYLYVPDADASYERAIRAGARSLQLPADQAYGDRTAAVQDEWGNQWFMGTPLREL